MRLPALSLLLAGAAQLGALCVAAQNSSWPVRSSGYTDLVQWDHYSLIVRIHLAHIPASPLSAARR
jgi:hypothetical protein